MIWKEPSGRSRNISGRICPGQKAGVRGFLYGDKSKRYIHSQSGAGGGKTVEGDGSFKFTLASAITDADLQAKVDELLSDITAQGNRLAEHMDIRDMKSTVD